MQLHTYGGEEYDIDALRQKGFEETTDIEQQVIEDFYQMQEEAYYQDSCESCDLYDKGFSGSYEEPPEPPTCEHPLVSNIVNNNPYFPFKHGCRRKIRGVIKKPRYWLKVAKDGVKCSYNACTNDATHYQVSPGRGINVCVDHRTTPLDKLELTDVEQLPNLELFCTHCGFHGPGWNRETTYEFTCPGCNHYILQEVD